MRSFGFEARLNRFACVDYHVLMQNRGEQPGAAPATDSAFQEGGTDMDVRGISSVSGAAPIRPAQINSGVREAQVSRPQTPRDELELSSAGKMLDQLSQNPDMRAERIARIKEAIANGTYDTDEKLEAALSRMFDSLGSELDIE